MEINQFFQELDSMFRTKNLSEIEGFVLRNMEEAQRQGDLPAVLAIANELGGIYRAASRFAEGEKACRVALEIVRVLKMENTEQHGTTLLNLAGVFSAEKRYQDAMQLYEQIASIYEQVGLSKDYRSAALYNNMSHVYDEMGNEIKAEAYARKALEIISSLPGFDVELATTYTTLACRFIKQQRYHEAERSLYTAEKIFQGLDGKENVHYAATLSALGEVYYHLGDYPAAAGYFERALTLIKANYGENASYAATCRNLAQVYGILGDQEKRTCYDSLAQRVAERIGER